MKIKVKINFASILYILFSYIFMMSHVLKIQPLLANFLVASIGLVSLMYCLLDKGKKNINIYLLLFGLILSIFMIISIVYNGNADCLEVLWIWSYMGIGTLVYNKSISYKVYSFVTYSIIAWIFIYILSARDVTAFLSYGSQNNISVYVLFFVIMCCISNLINNKKQSYLLIFLSLIICFWTGSRAGIISSIVLLLGNFIYNFIFVKKGKTIELIKMLIVIFVVLWVLNHFIGSYLILFTEKMARYGGTSIRFDIWAEYLKGAFSSVFNFLFGVDFESGTYRLLNFYNGNVHNSFLMMHSKFGIIPFLMIIILIIKTIKKSVTDNKYFLVVILLTISTRMFFDWIAFPGLYDVFFWYFVVYLIDVNSEKD